MKSKRLIVFLLFAFIPMIGVGVFLHLNGAGAADLTGADNPASVDAATVLKGFLFTLGSMLIPLLAVVFTQLIFKEPVFKGLGISFRFNRWWWIGWLLMPVIALAVLGVSLLMPGVHWTTESEAVQAGLQQIPGNVGPWGLIGVSLVSGLLTGATLNAVFAFGEEVAWRGFLVKEFKGMGFLKMSLLIGLIWGFWHSPLILNGHNYPDHPVAGVFMMVLMCLALTPILLYFRKKSGSVIVPAIMHGTFNAVIGLGNMFVAPQNDLLVGGPGLAGFIVLLLVDLAIWLFDRKWIAAFDER